MTKVAIITRTKDRPKLLERALASVQSQIYKDFIHVIINDGGSKEVIDELVQKYGTKSVIKVIHNDSSLGMEAASNKAIKSVESEYVAIHDDDDTWHEEFLDQTVRHLEATGAMGVVVRTDKIMEEIMSDGTVRHIKTEQWMPHVRVINLYRQCIDNQMTPITFLYRRKTLGEIGYYDEALPVCGDWDFGIRFLQKWDVDFIDPGFALANYHHRKFKPGAEGNTSYAGNDRARYYTNYLMNKYLRKELAEGRIGVGYIMSKLRYDESKMAQMASRIIPQPILKRVKKRIQN